MAAPTYTYSGNVYSTSVAGTVDFPLISTAGNAIQYLEASHVHVYSSANNGSSWAELIRPAQWNFVSGGTVVRLASGIAAGTWIKVKRITPIAGPYVTFQASSLLTAEQLNDESRSNSYVNQETLDDADLAAGDAAGAVSSAAAATATANTALSTSNTALGTANTASSTANAASSTAATSLSTSQTALANSQTAVSNAASAVTTSQTAASNAATALSTSQTASTNAATAVSTSNTAATNAATALSTANTSLTNSQTASQNAATALTNSQTSLTQSAAAVTTANNSNATAASASSVAASASTAAASATTTANTANSKADQAIAAVSSSINYTLVTNVAGIPANPANDTYVEVGNSTGIESFTPLAGKPAGFVGDSGLSVRMRYTTAGATWNWQNYYPNNAETRYLKLGSTGTVTSAMIADGAVSNADVSATAAIAGTKIAPDFGSQNATTTGTSTAGSFIPTSSTVPTNGLYLPSAGSVAISTGGVQRLTIGSDGTLIGTSATNLIARFTGPANGYTETTDGTGIARTQLISSVPHIGAASNHPLVLTTNNTERLRITSAGLVGVGDSAPDGIVHARQDVTSGNYQARLYVQNTDQKTFIGSYWRTGVGQYSVIQSTNDAESVPGVLLLNPSGGNVAIGTTSALAKLHLYENAATFIGTRSENSIAAWINGVEAGGNYTIYSNNSANILFSNGGSERFRCDSSGRLLVGTSSSRQVYYIDHNVQIEGATNSQSGISIVNNAANDSLPVIRLGKTRGASIVNNGDALGQIAFLGFDGSNLNSAGAAISAHVDGTPGANDMPGRLVFSTSSDNSAAPSERVRISSTGAIGLSGANYGTSGQVLTSSGSGAAPTWQAPAGASIGLAIALG